MDAERAIELSPQGSALIIVDMQAEGCERHGAGVKPVIQNLRALLDRFRRANGKIIHVQSVRTKDHPEFTFFGKEYSLIEDSPAVEFVEDLKPASDEVVVKKYSHDCFYQTSGITEAGSSALILKRFELSEAVEQLERLEPNSYLGCFINANSQGKDATAIRRDDHDSALHVPESAQGSDGA
jgi:nicotinamidase-related amidase